MNISADYRGSVITGNCVANRATARNVTIAGSPLADVPAQLAVRTLADSGDAATKDSADNYTDSRIGNTTVAPIHLNFDDSDTSGLSLGSSYDEYWHTITYVDGVITATPDEWTYMNHYTPVNFLGGVRTETISFIGDPVPLISLEIRPYTVSTVTSPQFGLFPGTNIATYAFSPGVLSACFASNIIPIGTIDGSKGPYGDVSVHGIYIAYTTSGTSSEPILFRLRTKTVDTVNPLIGPDNVDTELIPSGVTGKLVICRLNMPATVVDWDTEITLLAEFERAGTLDTNLDTLHVLRLAYSCQKISYSVNARQPQ